MRILKILTAHTIISYWKDDISVKVVAYLYIRGLKNCSVRADLMTNWQTGKYATLMELQNDVAKISLWRSSTTINIGGDFQAIWTGPQRQSCQHPKHALPRISKGLRPLHSSLNHGSINTHALITSRFRTQRASPPKTAPPKRSRHRS